MNRSDDGRGNRISEDTAGRDEGHHSGSRRGSRSSQDECRNRNGGTGSKDAGRTKRLAGGARKGGRAEARRRGKAADEEPGEMRATGQADAKWPEPPHAKHRER